MFWLKSLRPFSPPSRELARKEGFQGIAPRLDREIVTKERYVRSGLKEHIGR